MMFSGIRPGEVTSPDRVAILPGQPCAKDVEPRRARRETLTRRHTGRAAGKVRSSSRDWTNTRSPTSLGRMSEPSDSPVDRLWQEYGAVFRDFDDLTLARWMAQTLGQLEGRLWRMSHPLVGAYRLAAQIGHDRQLWLKRLANAPMVYRESECCRAPLLPLFTRDVIESGLLCQHCGATAIPFDELPASLKPVLRDWADEYADIHEVAHWDDRERKKSGDYDAALDRAAEEAQKLLVRVAAGELPKLLEHYPTLVWEDQDECLDVRPEDIELS